jgi:nicotinamide-nucleotide amidase
MRLEILCTGNELLDGSVVDTNSAWLEGELFALGEEFAEKRVVPDDMDALVRAFREISVRADACVVSGGLGPTMDDLTAEALALAAGVPLVESAAVAGRIQARLALRNRAYGPAQARQALVPEGAAVLENGHGTAPHLQLTVGRCRFYLAPGVPSEFRGICTDHVLPALRAQLQAQPGARSYAFTQIRCVNLWEADMAHAVRDLPAKYPGLRLGTRTVAPENHLKLRAEGATPSEAQAQLDGAVKDALGLLGDAAFTVGALSLPEVVFRKLLAAKATLALAESCTGGLVAGMITDFPGSSAVLRAGLVTYTVEAKVQFLGLDPAMIERENVVSAPVAQAMAERVRAINGTTYGCGVTGWAGPSGGTERDPTGTYYAACAGPKGTEVVRMTSPGLDRERVRKGAAYTVLDLLRRG